MCIKRLLIGLPVLLVWLSCNQLAPLEPRNLPPKIPGNIFPASDTTDIPIKITFIWSGGDPNDKDHVSYDFYLKADDPQPELVASELSDTLIYYDSLSYNTTYYWKVVARDESGETSSSPVWSFRTRFGQNRSPRMPANPQPENGNPSFSIENAILQWSGGDPDSFSVVVYDVYFGTKIDSLALLSDSQSDTFLALKVLNFNTRYYWKIVARDNYGLSTEGPVWHFTTEPVQLLFEDGFDSYPTNGYPASSIWTVNSSGATLFVSDSISWNNSGKSICFVDSTEQGSSFLATRLPVRSVGLLEFWWRIASSQDYYGMRLYSQTASDDHLGPQISIRQGKLQYYDANYMWQTITEIDTNQWYQIRLLVNCQQGYYQIAVNDSLMVPRATWIGSSVSSCDLLYFMTFDNRVCQRAFLDAIRFSGGSN